MAEHRPCHGCLDGCTAESTRHCVSCIVFQPWPCDASRLEAEVDRLNRLVDTLSRALARYQEEEDEVGGDDPANHPYQRRGSWSHDDWCAKERMMYCDECGTPLPTDTKPVTFNPTKGPVYHCPDCAELAATDEL